MTNFGIDNSADNTGLGAPNSGTSLNDFNSAMRVRDFVTSIATGVVNLLRPEIKLGRVTAFDPIARVAAVRYVDATQDVNVRWVASVDGPNAVGDMVEVRIDSKGAARIAKLVYSSLGDPLVDGHFIGEVITGSWLTAPAGTLQCNGAAISRTTYARLFAAIGTQNGTGDGSTTFNLPDYMGATDATPRFPLSGVTVGSKGGVTTHTHGPGTLATQDHSHTFGSAFVEVVFNAAAGNNVFMNKKATATWVPSVGWTNSPQPSSLSTSQSQGAVIGGTTDNAGALSVTTGVTAGAAFYSPWQGAMVVIKY